MQTEYNKDNFFENTYGVFKQVQLARNDITFLGNPDFVSNSGSKYWYKGNKLYRYANHWDYVASCVWKIKGHYNARKNYKLGVIKFDKFERICNNISVHGLFSEYFMKKLEELNRMSNLDIRYKKIYEQKIKLNFIWCKYRFKTYYMSIYCGIGIDDGVQNEYNRNQHSRESMSCKCKNYELLENYIKKIERIVLPKIENAINSLSTENK